MTYNPDIHHRKSVRLRQYDYSQAGAYFVTICTQNRECLFGKIENGEMMLNDAGKMIGHYWGKLEKRFECVHLDEYVIMPNHFHGIIAINDHIQIVGAPLVGAHQKGRAQDPPLQMRKKSHRTTIGEIVGTFKSLTTYEYILNVALNGWESFDGRLWQRDYYERIIRDEQSLGQIREYVINNPLNWEKDELFL